jgi:hypothetical protein
MSGQSAPEPVVAGGTGGDAGGLPAAGTDHEAAARLDPALERRDRRVGELIAPLLENQHGLGLKSAHGRDLLRMNP